MSYTKTFIKRSIGLSKENKELLTEWSNHQQKYVVGQSKNIFYYDLKNEKPKEGFFNNCNRMGESFMGLGCYDCGLYMELDSLEIDLDSHAHKFLLDFEIDLIRISKKLSLSSSIDKDKIKNGVLLQNEFALLKEILLRTLAKTLEKNGSVNNSSEQYFLVFKEMIVGLNKLSIANTNQLLELFNIKESSDLILELGNSLESWVKKAEPIIKSVHELHRTQTIIKNNLKFLNAKKLKLLQHLHYRLKKTSGDNVAQTEYLEANTIEGVAEWEKDIICKNSSKVPSLECDLLLMPIADALKSGNNTTCYVFDGQELYYINTNNTQEVVTISNKGQLEQGLEKIKKTEHAFDKPRITRELDIVSMEDKLPIHDTESILHLSSEQASILISRNGGHTNAFDKMTLEERAKIICTLLAETNEAKKILFNLNANLPWIQKLYKALVEIELVIAKLNNVDNLTSILGFFFFMFNLFNGSAINKAIDLVSMQADAACNDPALNGTELRVIGLSDLQIQKADNPNFDFSSLNGTEYQQTGYSIVFSNLRQLSNNTHSTFFEFINESSLRALVKALFRGKLLKSEQSYTVKELLDIQPWVAPETLGVQTQDQVRINVQSDVLQVVEDNGAYYKIKSDDTFYLNKDNIFNILRIQRHKTIRFLMEKIDDNRKVQEIIRLEALEYFKNKTLPISWGCLLANNGQYLKYYNDNFFNSNVRQLSLNTLCLALRDLLKINIHHSNSLYLNDADLIDYIQTYASQLFESEGIKPLYEEFTNAKKEVDRNLEAIFANKKVLSAYVQYRYLDEKDGFIYRPNQSNLISELFKIMQIPIQIWVETQGGQYKKLESFNLENTKTASYDLLLLNTGMNIGFSVFQRFDRSARMQEQNKTALKKLLLDITSTHCPLSVQERQSLLTYFCINNQSIANTGLKVALDNVDLAKKELKKYEKRLNLNEALIKEGELYVLERIIEMLEQLNQKTAVNIRITESYIEKTRATMKQAIISYCSEGIVMAYERLKMVQENQGIEGLRLRWKDEEYWLASLPAQANSLLLRDCRLYKKPDRNLYYALDHDNEHKVFEEKVVRGDGQCGLISLGIKRAELVRTLTEAIKNVEDRKILALEIYNYLITMHTEDKKYWDRNFLSSTIETAINKRYAFYEKIDSVMSYFKVELGLSFSGYQACLDYLTNHPNHKIFYKDKINMLQDLVSHSVDCEAALLDLCTEYNMCSNYVKKYESDDFWLGKYSAKIYAKNKNITLYIYDKNVSKLPFVLSWDPESSYISKKQSDIPPKRVVYENGSHFNILLLNDEIKISHPQRLWKEYSMSLEAQLQARLSTYLPSPQILLDDYLQDIEQIAKNDILLNIDLTVFDQQIIKSCSSEIALRKDLIDFQTKRESIRKGWQLGSQKVTNYIQKTLAGFNIEDYDLEDMVIMPDEYLDEKNQTLLLRVVQQKNQDLVVCLLQLGASVVKPSDRDFELRINQKISLSGIKPLTYLLSKNKEKWVIIYHDDLGQRHQRLVEEFDGLANLLSQKDLADERVNTAIQAIFHEDHRLMYSTTPLLEAAKEVKNIAVENSLLSILIQSGFNELRKDMLAFVSSNTLKHLSEQIFSSALKAHLENYLKERQNTVKEHPEWSKLNQKILQLFNQDRTEERAIQFAKILQILIEVEKTRNYQFAADRCENITVEAEKRDNSMFVNDQSVLMQGTKIIANNSTAYIRRNCTVYSAQYENYLESKLSQIESEKSEKKLVRIIKEGRDANIKLQIQQVDSVKKINDLTTKLDQSECNYNQLQKAFGSIEEAMNSLVSQRQEDMKLIHRIVSREPQLQKENNQANPNIVLNLTNNSTETSNPSSSEEALLVTSAMQREEKKFIEVAKTNFLVNNFVSTAPVSIKTNIQKFSFQNSYPTSSSLGFFSEGSVSLSLTSWLRNNPNSEFEIKKWLEARGWSLNVLSDREDNFFAALAREINRTKGSENESSEDELDFSEIILRNLCYAFYIKNTKMVKQLNDTLKINLKNAFDNNRNTYKLIENNWITAEKMGESLPIISGVGSVEGIILCKDLQLEAIYVVSVGNDNNFQFAKATANGFFTNISEAEIEKNIETCPVLLKIGLSYQCIKGPFIKTVTLSETEIATVSNRESEDSSDFSLYEENQLSFIIGR